ncbi:MAG: hypothetical protein JST28_00710 [Acidobacteria bacterium]|nr:hypothetical protein [Acidobacteriota bacterium]
MRRGIAFIAAITPCTMIAACGSKVSDRTYHNNGGVVQVEFKRDGRALVSAGNHVHACSYTESGSSVRLTCQNEDTEFRMQDDGALVGPARGPMARLTPVEN